MIQEKLMELKLVQKLPKLDFPSIASGTTVEQRDSHATCSLLCAGKYEYSKEERK